MQKIKKILLFIILSFWIFFSSIQVLAEPPANVWSIDLLDQDSTNNKMANPTWAYDPNAQLWANSSDQIDWADWILMKIVKFARESIFNLLWVIVVWVLLYIWFKLIIWKWTPDIFKKAMMGFVYLIIWVVIIYTAWAMVKIILWVNF